MAPSYYILRDSADNPSSMAIHVPRHLLLTMPGCCVECAGIEYRGTLALEYVAVAPTGQLVLRVGAFEMPVPRTQPVVHRRAKAIYEIPGTPTPATLLVPLVAPNASARVVLDAFGVLLARYAVVRDADDGPRAAGRPDDPQVGGQVVVVALSRSVAAQGDPRWRKKRVILADPHAPPELHVRALLPEETAALLQTAHALSRGIALATTMIAEGMARASSTFVARTAPSPTPVLFSAVTRRSIVDTHALSGAAVAASAHATELVLHVVDHSVVYVAQGSRSPRRSSPPLGVGALGPSADLVVATLSQSSAHLMTHGTRALASSLGHRYGADVGDAVRLGSDIARNVGAVYNDARAVGRPALLLRAGQRVVAACATNLFDNDASLP